MPAALRPGRRLCSPKPARAATAAPATSPRPRPVPGGLISDNDMRAECPLNGAMERPASTATSRSVRHRAISARTAGRRHAARGPRGWIVLILALLFAASATAELGGGGQQAATESRLTAAVHHGVDQPCHPDDPLQAQADDGLCAGMGCSLCAPLTQTPTIALAGRELAPQAPSAAQPRGPTFPHFHPPKRSSPV